MTVSYLYIPLNRPFCEMYLYMCDNVFVYVTAEMKILKCIDIDMCQYGICMYRIFKHVTKNNALAFGQTYTIWSIPTGIGMFRFHLLFLASACIHRMALNALYIFKLSSWTIKTCQSARTVNSPTMNMFQCSSISLELSSTVVRLTNHPYHCFYQFVTFLSLFSSSSFTER